MNREKKKERRTRNRRVLDFGFGAQTLESLSMDWDRAMKLLLRQTIKSYKFLRATRAPSYSTRTWRCWVTC